MWVDPCLFKVVYLKLFVKGFLFKVSSYSIHKKSTIFTLLLNPLLPVRVMISQMLRFAYKFVGCTASHSWMKVRIWNRAKSGNNILAMNGSISTLDLYTKTCSRSRYTEHIYRTWFKREKNKSRELHAMIAVTVDYCSYTRSEAYVYLLVNRIWGK